MQSFISSLPKKEPLKFPSLPIQSPPDEGWFWEELSDLFVNTVRGGKNYREVLYQRRMLKVDYTTEKKRFKATDLSADEALLSRKSLNWMELGMGCLDSNIKLYYGKTMFAAQLSHFSSTARHCPYCLDNLGVRVDQTFLHGCLECPNVAKLYRGMAQIFGFTETLPLNAKDIFIWKKFFKSDKSNNRNKVKLLKC